VINHKTKEVMVETNVGAETDLNLIVTNDDDEMLPIAGFLRFPLHSLVRILLNDSVSSVQVI
jgi:mannose-6-phosphate isomerase class I